MTDITDAPIFYWHESPGNRFRVDVGDADEAAECPHCVPVYSAETVDRLRARVAELEAEVLAEREACAKPLDEAAERLLAPKRTNEVYRHVANVLQQQAAAIRARGER